MCSDGFSAVSNVTQFLDVIFGLKRLTLLIGGLLLLYKRPCTLTEVKTTISVNHLVLRSVSVEMFSKKK